MLNTWKEVKTGRKREATAVEAELGGLKRSV